MYFLFSTVHQFQNYNLEERLRTAVFSHAKRKADIETIFAGFEKLWTVSSSHFPIWGFPKYFLFQPTIFYSSGQRDFKKLLMSLANASFFLLCSEGEMDWGGFGPLGVNANVASLVCNLTLDFLPRPARHVHFLWFFTFYQTIAFEFMNCFVWGCIKNTYRYCMWCIVNRFSNLDLGGSFLFFTSVML